MIASSPTSKIIDNTKLLYTPVQLKCGVQLRLRPDVYSYPRIIQDVEEDILACFKSLPKSVHNLIKRTIIWINVTFMYGSKDTPKILKHTATHHYREWLIHTLDIPEKTHGIEIYNCFEYQALRLHWNGCGLLLHEYCHLIHQLVLENGLNNLLVQQTFHSAVESKLYEKVFRRDWACLPNEQDTAYATINEKEFFAELSVAYLSLSYPQLDNNFDQNSSIFASSPPFQDPIVLLRIKEHERKKQLQQQLDKKVSSIQYFISKITSRLFSYSNGILRTTKGHCNKFFPFTHGQFKQYDFDSWSMFHKLWSEISNWTDDLELLSSRHDFHNYDYCCQEERKMSSDTDSCCFMVCSGQKRNKFMSISSGDSKSHVDMDNDKNEAASNYYLYGENEQDELLSEEPTTSTNAHRHELNQYQEYYEHDDCINDTISL